MSETGPQSQDISTSELHRETPPCQTEQQGTVSSPSINDVALDNLNKEPAATSENSTKKPQCRFYKKTGKCRYGEGCKFAHEAAIGGQKGTEAETGGGATCRSEIDELPSEEVKTTGGDTPQVCRYYSRSGWCRYGKWCRFLHERAKTDKPPAKASKQDESNTALQACNADCAENVSAEKGTTDSKSVDSTQKQKSNKICKFWKAGNCRMGDKCKFTHEKAGDLSSESPQTKPARPNAPNAPKTAVKKPASVSQAEVFSVKVANLGEEDLKKLRETEVVQLMKRFTQDKLTVLGEGSSDGMYRVTINPTDPDWPYDIQDFEFELMFPTTYPADPFTITMPEDQVLPSTVLTYMTKSIEEWVLARHGTNNVSRKVEMMFRPFLRWLDRSLERLFTDAAKRYKTEVDAKAAGIELVPYAKQKPAEPREIKKFPDDRQPDATHDTSEGAVILQGESSPNNTAVTSDCKSQSEETTIEAKNQNITKNGGQVTNLPSAKREVEETENENKTSDLFNVQRRGTEIKFQDVQMSESVSTLVPHQIGVTIQCSRCKNKCDVITPPKRPNIARCGKCQHQQLVTFRSSLVHHFTATLGFLDLEGCTAFDFILSECVFAVGCLNCSAETTVEGLHFGQIRTLWCETCHTKMTLQLETTKFHHLQASYVKAGDNAHIVQVKQIRKQVHPDIHEGHPLPNNGTCKHYKKSFRWFRFPCCSKCYPCDECHDENEIDHEMKYATRMICGFCCKEQQYTPDKPCIACNSMTTKGRTSHWEGGMGCRNKIKMSRNDKQKYSSINKTVSRKQQNEQTK